MKKIVKLQCSSSNGTDEYNYEHDFLKTFKKWCVSNVKLKEFEFEINTPKSTEDLYLNIHYKWINEGYGDRNGYKIQIYHNLFNVLDWNQYFKFACDEALSTTFPFDSVILDAFINSKLWEYSNNFFG